MTPTEYNSAIPPRGTQAVVFKVVQDLGGTQQQTHHCRQCPSAPH